jgi:hypothetical protein
MKAIFKPTFLKILFTLVLLVVSSYLWRMVVISRISDTFPWGFPLQFYLAWGPCPPGETCSETNILFFLVDVLFWYIVGGFLTSGIANVRA